MRNFLILASAFVALVSCKQEKELSVDTSWEFDKVIQLEGVNPIGIAVDGNDMFLSDGDNNRVVKVDATGSILFEYDGFERPMHIDFGEAAMQITDKVTTSMLKERALFVPEYGRDSIAVIRDNKRDYLVFKDSLDAPAAISVFKNEIAIADFYNHRILYYNGSSWLTIGKEGKEHGMFYYPTDVQITSGGIYVADAYNNRGQVFDKNGAFKAVFGEGEKMNAATGIYVGAGQIYLTDFENKRVLVFSKDYTLKQELKTEVSKPTDVIIVGDKLLITDYAMGALVQYKISTVSK